MPLPMPLARLLAVLATAAHNVDRLVRHALGWVRLGWVPGGLLVGLALVWLTVSTVLATVEAYGDRPEPSPATLGAVARGEVGSSTWVVMPALVSLDGFEAEVQLFDGGAPVGSVLYRYLLAREPDDPATALVLRHPADLPAPLHRSLEVSAVSDPQQVAAAVDALGPAVRGEPAPDPDIVLVEAPEPGSVSAASPVPLASVGVGPDPTTVQGRVLAASAPTGDGAFWYLLVDHAAQTARVLRSPHPPDRLPAAVSGTIVEDRFHMRSLLADWQPEERLGDVEVLSDTRLLAWGSGPAFADPSWLPAIIAGALAAIVLAGLAIGYPVFVRRRDPVSATARPRAGEPLEVQLFGRIRGPRGELRLDGVPGTLEWLPVSEVARTRWRYWGAALGDYRRDVEAAVRGAGGDGEQLVVHSPVGSLMWSLEPGDSPTIEAGDAHVGLARHPALRVRAARTQICLLLSGEAARDRALAELRFALSRPR